LVKNKMTKPEKRLMDKFSSMFWQVLQISSKRKRFL